MRNLVELLGISDVAALLDEPEHVVNVACARFAIFIPMVRIGRDRWYPPEAVPVLRVIFDQIRVGVPDEHIETVLTKRFPVTRIASQDLAGQTEAAQPAPEVNTRTTQVREVFDRYQSTIQNEMLQMRREIAQMAPSQAPPAIARPEMSLSELARQDDSTHYLDPRSYGFTHLADLQRQQTSDYRAPQPQGDYRSPQPQVQGDYRAQHLHPQDEYRPPQPQPVPQPERTEVRATQSDFEDGLSEDAKTILSAISRQAAASETANLRHDMDAIRGEVGALFDQFRAFSQQLGVYQDVRERSRPAATGTHGSPSVPTKLEVVANDRNERTERTDRNERDTFNQAQVNGHIDGNANGLLGQLTKRSPRRMGRSLTGADE